MLPDAGTELKRNICCREHANGMGGMSKLRQKVIVVRDNLGGGQLAVVASSMTVGH